MDFNFCFVLRIIILGPFTYFTSELPVLPKIETLILAVIPAVIYLH